METEAQTSTTESPQTTAISRSLLIFTYLLASFTMWAGLTMLLHIAYIAAGMHVYSLFDSAPIATVITALVLILCCFSLIPAIKTAWVKIALQVASFMNILAFAGPLSILAMILIYTQSEIDQAYCHCIENCGLASVVICAVFACVNYFLQSRNKSIKRLSMWTIGESLLVIILSISAFL